MCGYFCIEFIDFMFKGNSITDLALLNFFHQIISTKNDDIILNYFLTNL